MELLNLPGLDRTTAAFRSALVELSHESALDPNKVGAVISLESGFDPTAINGTHAGLIQFSRRYFAPIAERAEMDVDWEDLPELSAEEQLPLVMAWFRLHGLTWESRPVDYLLSVFMPGYMGRPPSHVLAKRGDFSLLPGSTVSLDEVYRQNTAYDTNGDGEITISDLESKIEGVIARARRSSGLPPAAPPEPRTDWGWLFGGALVFGGLGLAVSHHRRS